VGSIPWLIRDGSAESGCERSPHVFNVQMVSHTISRMQNVTGDGGRMWGWAPTSSSTRMTRPAPPSE
jgi:hypothetical protein